MTPSPCRAGWGAGLGMGGCYLRVAFLLSTNLKINQLKRIAGADQGSQRLRKQREPVAKMWMQSSLMGLAFCFQLPFAWDAKVTLHLLLLCLPTLVPLPAGMKACRQPFICKRCKLKPQVPLLGWEPFQSAQRSCAGACSPPCIPPIYGEVPTSFPGLSQIPSPGAVATPGGGALALQCMSRTLLPTQILRESPQR